MKLSPQSRHILAACSSSRRELLVGVVGLPMLAAAAQARAAVEAGSITQLEVGVLNGSTGISGISQNATKNG